MDDILHAVEGKYNLLNKMENLRYAHNLQMKIKTVNKPVSGHSNA